MEINRTILEKQVTIPSVIHRAGWVFTALFFLFSISQQLAAGETPANTPRDYAPMAKPLGFSGSDRENFSESNLRKAIETGAYGMIESTSFHFANAKEDVKKARFSTLSRDLAALKLPHRQITGVYKGHKTGLSFLVLKPSGVEEEVFKKMLFTLGAKYLQESIIFSAKLRPGETEKRNYLIFTTGEHAGYSRSGTGFIENNKENYSEITTAEGTTIVIGAYNLEKEFRKHPELLSTNSNRDSER